VLEARAASPPIRSEGLSLDAAVVPALLLLIGRDLLMHDPPRVLAWRVLHDPQLAAAARCLESLPAWLSGGPDRDPLAGLLGRLALGLALAYLLAALAGARPRVRAALVAGGALCLVVLPTLGFVALGWVTGRPVGQDGGVVQLPLAMDRILSGDSPYGADYSDSMLGKQARVSAFWTVHGGNPILHHHAYLPGTHLVMMPAYLLLRGAGLFDARLVTLLAYAVATLVAARLVTGSDARLAAAALVALNPLVYWPQQFGANDLVAGAFLLLSLRLAVTGRPGWAGTMMGLACATKQLAWPFAPFLLAHLSGARTLREMFGAPARARMVRPAAAALGVFAAVVVPVAALDLRAFWSDVVVYNAGLSAGDNYPLGGTPGIGFANVIVYLGRVGGLREQFDFAPFHLLLVPLGLLLLRSQLREGHAARVLTAGSAALLLFVYFARVAHPNYLILAAVALPLGFLMGERRGADVAVVPLLLIALSVEVAANELLRTSWEDAVSVRLPRYLSGVSALLAPRAGPLLSRDPLGLLLSATAAGLGIAYLTAGLLREGARTRAALLAAAVAATAVVPTVTLVRMTQATGIWRVQDGWSAEASGGATTREAWSQSFRRDPPRRWDGGTEGAPRRDRRWVGLLGYAAAIPLLALLVPPPHRLFTLGGILLNPCSVVGLVFGSPVGVALGLLASCLLVAAVRTRVVWVAILSLAWVTMTGLAAPHLLALPLACVVLAAVPRAAQPSPTNRVA
jgi:hypothetical protein